MSGYSPTQQPSYGQQPNFPYYNPQNQPQQQQQQQQQQRLYGGGAYFVPAQQLSPSSPSSTSASPATLQQSASSPLHSGIFAENTGSTRPVAAGAYTAGTYQQQQPAYSYSNFPPQPQQRQPQQHVPFIDTAFPRKPTGSPHTSVYSSVAAAAPPPDPQQQQQQRQQHHVGDDRIFPSPPQREDLLGSGPAESENSDAHMNALVNAAKRAKAAGDSSGFPPSSSAPAPPGSRKRQLRDVEFVVGPPQYRVRTALLFAAALFGMIPLMSTFALTVLLTGIIGTYIADYLGHIKVTVLALLGTAITFAVTLLLSNLHSAVTGLGPMLMLIDLTGVLLMATASCLLHFRSLQETRPDTICLLERCVMTVTPILSLPSLMTSCIALVGSRYGPFAFLAAMCALHHQFYGPLKSSFMVVAVSQKELKCYVTATTGGGSASAKSKGGDKRAQGGQGKATESVRLANDLPSMHGDTDDGEGGTVAFVPQQLNDRSHAAVFTLLLLFLPLLLYNFLQTNWEEHVFANLANSLGLLCGSFAYLCMSPWHSLWFLAPSPEELVRTADTQAQGKTESAEMSPETVALLLAYDPLGLQYIVKTYRTRVLSAVAVLGVLWATHRLTHSRYAYLFDGVPYPFNMVCLLVALMVSALLVVELFVLMSADNAGEDVSRGQHVARRVSVVVASIVVVLLFCALGSAPGIFYFLGVLSVTALNIFLVDRSNAGPMIVFTVFSSLLLLWWMYRTFSFVVVDLRVLNGTGKVSSALLAVSVLWSYVLGCMCFLFSFSKSKAFLIGCVLLHSLEVTFVEEVLVAQREDGAYPAILVFFTSSLGALIGYRFYKNEVLGIQGAAFVASCYLAKILTLFVETTSAYYAGELEALSPDLAAAVLTSEVSVSWWAALLGCYVVTVFEMERQKKLAPREAVRLPYLYLVAAALVSLCTVRNVQRAVYEFATQSYVAGEEFPHIALGTVPLTFAILTWPFFAHQAHRYQKLTKLAALGKLAAVVGVLLLAIQPTRITESHVSALDYELPSADKGRYAAVAGLTLLLCLRVIPMQRLHFFLRVFYWLTVAVLLAFGITAQLLPVPTFPLFACMFGLVFLMLLLVDLTHYRDLTSFEGVIVYGTSFLVVVGSFAVMGRIDLLRAAGGNASLAWEMHNQSRTQLLSIIAVVNLFVGLLLRFRYAGRPLLPNCVAMTAAIEPQVGLVCNYSILFSVCTLSVLNFWANQSKPFLYVALSLLLLVLVDDGTLFFDLHLRNYRYFPCVAFAFATLWFCQFYHGWSMSVSMGLLFRVFAAVRGAAFALPLLPAQLSLLYDLWDVEGPPASASHRRQQQQHTGAPRREGKGPDRVVIATTVISLLVFVFTSSEVLTWMSLVCICGQCARLFGHSLLTSGTAPRRS